MLTARAPCHLPVQQTRDSESRYVGDGPPRAADRATRACAS